MNAQWSVTEYCSCSASITIQGSYWPYAEQALEDWRANHRHEASRKDEESIPLQTLYPDGIPAPPMSPKPPRTVGG